MSLKNKTMALIGVVALVTGGSLLAASPALAVVNYGITAYPTSEIAHGDAISVTFNVASSSWLNAGGAYRSFCLYKSGTRFTSNTTAPEITAFNSGDDPDGYVESASFGTVNDVLNRNSSAQDFYYQWIAVQFTAPNDCSSLSSDLSLLDSDPIVDGWAVAKRWTVTPALDAPIAQTLTVGMENSTAATISEHSVSSTIDVSVGSHWTQEDLANCDELNTTTPQQVDLSTLGLELDGGTSAPNTIAPLLITGTPTEASDGEYQLCVSLNGDSRSVYAFFDVTLEAATPATAASEPETPTTSETAASTALASTGTEGSGWLVAAFLLLGGGFGVAAMSVAARGRRATK
jgi:hypothetical protein